MYKRNLVLWAALLLMAVNPAFAAAPVADEVEFWADSLFAEALAKKRMSGAVLTMVQDGEIVLSKGFGFADYTAQSPVDPDDTRFRIGSNTKTFTALAIAQLMDDGRISSLDDPANLYLKRMQLPTVDGVEISLSHLLTHSAGFESRAFNIGTDRVADLPLSAAEIARFKAEVVNPPGKYSSYNNYGTTILGLIVEDVSSTTIADYFDEHIFSPLGMTNSVLSMSPAETDGLGVPHGFLPNGDALAFKNRTVQQFYAPVGAINATGNDMGRYMIAQLAQGSNSESILSHGMFEKMHTQIRSNHPLSSGFGMIYFTWNWNGQKIALHGGDWPGTHSAMLLLPDSNTGVFFSLLADFPEVPIMETILGSERLEAVNGVTVDTPITNLGVLYAFLTRFYGAFEKPQLADFTLSDLYEFAGNYVGQAAPVSTMERLLSLTSPFLVVNVAVAEAGQGLMINDVGPYREIGPGVFWSDEISSPLDGLFLNSPLFNFVRDENGEVDYLTPQIGFDAWVKSGWLGNPQTYSTAWALLFLISLTSVITIFYPKIEGRRAAKWLPSIVMLLLIAMPLTLVLGYPTGESVLDELFLGRTARFTLFAIISNIVALCAVYFALQVYRAWQEGYWHNSKAGLAMRVHYSVLGVTSTLFIPVFYYLNLLGM